MEENTRENYSVTEKHIEDASKNNTMLVVGKEKIDIETFLEESTDTFAKKIRKLYQFGVVNSEQAKAVFIGLTSGVITNEDEILESLPTVYDVLVDFINKSSLVPYEILPDTDEVVISENKIERFGFEYVPDFTTLEKDALITEFLEYNREVIKSNDAKPSESYVFSSPVITELVGRYDNEKDILHINTDEILDKPIEEMSTDEQAVYIDNDRDAAFLGEVFQYVIRPDSYNPENGEITEYLQKKFGDSKYFEAIIDEKTGKFDLEKARNLKDSWINLENKVMTQNYLKKALDNIRAGNKGFDPQNIAPSNKKFMAVIMARGYFADDPKSKQYFAELCNEIGINNTEEDVLAFVDTLVGNPIRTINDLKRYKLAGDVRDRNVTVKLKNIEKSLTPETRREKGIQEIISDLRASMPKEQIEDGTFAKVVARLYCEMVSGKDKKGVNRYDNDTRYIKRYMSKHHEMFGEYLRYVSGPKGGFQASLKKIKDSPEMEFEGEFYGYLQEKFATFYKKEEEFVQKAQARKRNNEAKGKSGKISDAEIDFEHNAEEMDVSAIEELRINQVREKYRKTYSYKAIKETDREYITFDSIKDIDLLDTVFTYIVYPERVDTRITDMTEYLHENFADSKYLKEVINPKTGEFDQAKAAEFKKRWTKIYNKIAIHDDMEEICTKLRNGEISLETMDAEAKTNLAIDLARGFFTEDEETKKNFEEICALIGIGSDFESISNFANPTTNRNVRIISELFGYKESHEMTVVNFPGKFREQRKKMLEQEAEREDTLGDEEKNDGVEPNAEAAKSEVILSDQRDDVNLGEEALLSGTATEVAEVENLPTVVKPRGIGNLIRKIFQKIRGVFNKKDDRVTSKGNGRGVIVEKSIDLSTPKQEQGLGRYLTAPVYVKQGESQLGTNEDGKITDPTKDEDTELETV